MAKNNKNKILLASVLCLQLSASHAMTGNWSVGAGTIIAPNPYLDTKTNILPIPLVSYQNKYASWYGPMIKLRHYLSPKDIIGPLAYLDTRVFDPEDTSNAQLKQLNKRDRLYMLGGYYRHKTDIGDLFFSVSGDISGNSDGFYSELAYSYPLTYQNRKYFFRPSIGVQWSSKKIVNHFYGISPTESLNSGLSNYNPGGAVSPFAGLFAGINLFGDIYWLTMLRASYMPNPIHQSPMVRKDRLNYTALIGLTWELGKKETRFNK